MNWANGDFVTPAVMRYGGATVAVSTNGASCSSAKAIRQSIGQFLKSRGAGRLTVVGTDDRLLASAPQSSAVALGVAYPFQLLKELPSEPHDIALTDVVVAS